MVLLEVVVAVVVILSVVLPARRILRRNGWLGIRTTATLASDEAWARGHRAAVLPASLTGGIAIVGGVVAMSLGHGRDIAVVVGIAVVLVAGGVWIAAVARRAAMRSE
ncbi:SdpI family protein [Microbacterium sp. NPDC057650]|uniref:SdpI family protein n=1 Tax=unclassified Microbacterium TaxID=2609290 RepID=UPI00366B19E3